MKITATKYEARMDGVIEPITADTLADTLWTEMAMWQAKSPLLMQMFEWKKTRIICRDHRIRGGCRRGPGRNRRRRRIRPTRWPGCMQIT